MNPDAPQTPREELEMRLTALLMGELSREEAAALERQIAADPDLAALHARLRQAMKLLREASALPEQPAPVQLSAERRERLLAHFQTAVPAPSAAPIIKLPRRDWSWAVPLGLAAALIALLGGTILMNGFMPSEASRAGRGSESDFVSDAVPVQASPSGWAEQSGVVRSKRAEAPARSFFKLYSSSDLKPAESAPAAPPSGPATDGFAQFAPLDNAEKISLPAIETASASRAVRFAVIPPPPAAPAPSAGATLDFGTVATQGVATVEREPALLGGVAASTPKALASLVPRPVTALAVIPQQPVLGNDSRDRQVEVGGFQALAGGRNQTSDLHKNGVALDDLVTANSPMSAPAAAIADTDSDGGLIRLEVARETARQPAQEEFFSKELSSAGGIASREKSDGKDRAAGTPESAKLAKVAPDRLGRLEDSVRLRTDALDVFGVVASSDAIQPAPLVTEFGEPINNGRRIVANGSDPAATAPRSGADHWAFDGTVAADGEKPALPDSLRRAGDQKADDKKTVARTAFWFDDNSAKANANTATEGTFWDVPAQASPVQGGENGAPDLGFREGFVSGVGGSKAGRGANTSIGVLDPTSRPELEVEQKLKREIAAVDGKLWERGNESSQQTAEITKGLKADMELALGEKRPESVDEFRFRTVAGQKPGAAPAKEPAVRDLSEIEGKTRARAKGKADAPAAALGLEKQKREMNRGLSSQVEKPAEPSLEKARKEVREELAVAGKPVEVAKLAEYQRKAAFQKLFKADAPAPSRPATPAPVPQPEIATSANAFSTFSLNVSDVAFKLAGASLEQGQMPELGSVRSEEFINAFDYRDPEPTPGAPLAFASELARYPFAQNRDLLRLSVKTAAAGRQPGRPLNLVLLLDNSGSMERADRVNIVREALRVLATQLQPQDKLSVVTFARTPRLWADGVAGDKAGEVTARVGEITPQGGTNLAAALDLGYATALRHYQAGGISRVVLLTDGAANLGDVNPDALKQKVEAHRQQGVALDCFGIGWEGLNDDLLEQLSRNGDGRYGFINTPEEAATNFAAQLAGALQVAASDVKVQVEWNPRRVTAYRQIGYAKHQLKKEQFRDNTVDAAEIGAAESGNALYVLEVNPRGEGDLATVRVRFKVPGTSDYKEHEWTVPFTANTPPLEQASPALRLAGTAGAFSEWLAASPYATEVTTDRLLGLLNGVPTIYGADPRPQKLEWMIRTAKSVSGR